MPKYECWKCGKTKTTLVGPPINTPTCPGNGSDKSIFISHNWVKKSD